ncbi:MAG: hypothetical protein OXC46_05045 [Thaumarchaeota archaeon]|nr:hypothetical protein [Nitrososphaerota archaeon]
MGISRPRVQNSKSYEFGQEPVYAYTIGPVACIACTISWAKNIGQIPYNYYPPILVWYVQKKKKDAEAYATIDPTDTSAKEQEDLAREAIKKFKSLN